MQMQCEMLCAQAWASLSSSSLDDKRGHQRAGSCTISYHGSHVDLVFEGSETVRHGGRLRGFVDLALHFPRE